MRQSKISPAQAAGGAILLVMFGFLAWFWYRPGVWSKLSIVVHQNWFFYILLVMGPIYAAWRRYSNPKQFVIAEVPVQVLGSATILYIITHFFFFYGSELQDIEDWNGHTTYVEYQEEHDSETCTTTCDEDGNNCSTDCDCTTWPPSWTIYTNNPLRTGKESTGTAPSIYKRYVTHFGNNRTSGSMGDSCNGNPGTTWVTEYKGQPDRLVPTAIEHDFVNYLKASKSIRKTTGGNTEGFEGQLLPYPRVHGGHFGNIYLDRVLDPNKIAPEEWTAIVDDSLDRALATLGQRKEVNILVYVVGTEDQAFLQALEEHWIHGKQNDVIVIIGSTKFPDISWVEIMSWDKGEEFDVALKRRITNLNNIGDGEKFADEIIQQVALPPEQGGFDRMSMKEYSYVGAEVEIAFWAMFVIFLLYAFLTWLLSWALENNEIRDAFARPINNRFRRNN
jgi:hypothetical protein